MVSKKELKLFRQFQKQQREKKLLKRFGKEIRKLPQSQIPIQQPIQQIKRPVQQQPQRRGGTGIINFFEHRTEKEVYGDEGLTLFDSQKKSRSQSSTGELFGFG